MSYGYSYFLYTGTWIEIHVYTYIISTSTLTPFHKKKKKHLRSCYAGAIETSTFYEHTLKKYTYKYIFYIKNHVVFIDFNPLINTIWTV